MTGSPLRFFIILSGYLVSFLQVPLAHLFVTTISKAHILYLFTILRLNSLYEHWCLFTYLVTCHYTCFSEPKRSIEYARLLYCMKKRQKPQGLEIKNYIEKILIFQSFTVYKPCWRRYHDIPPWKQWPANISIKHLQIHSHFIHYSKHICKPNNIYIFPKFSTY